MGRIKQQVKSYAIKGILIIGIPVIVLGGVIGATINSAGATYDDGLTNYSSTENCIVKTNEPGALTALSKSQLKTAIETCYSGQEQANMLSVLDDLVSVQSEKNVNAAFMLAVTHIESSGGTAWDNIADWTHNWMSVSWGAAWNGASGQTYTGHHEWCCYSSFNEAIQKFGVYITDSSYYFKAGKYTIDEIAPTYCNADWGESIKSEINKIYSSLM